MTTLDDANPVQVAEVDELREAYSVLRDSYMHLQESFADLERDTESAGWRKLAAGKEREFSDEALKRIATACQLMAVKNPLIQRGLSLRAAYTWAQGVEIKATSKRVDKVIQDFVSAEDNQEALFGPAAQVGRDISVGTDGNIVVALFTDPMYGTVKVRTIPFTEVGRVICNPEDRLDVWFVRHDTCVDEIGPDGTIVSRTHFVWHPTIGDHPNRPGKGFFRNGRIEGYEILWDAPVLHLAENRPDGWKFGVPVAYSSVDWALAHKEFLSDWATYMKALSRIAWRFTGPGRKQAAARSAIAAAPAIDPMTGEALFAGATATLGLDQRLEAIPKSGATIDANSADPLVNMIAAGLGVPITALLCDPSRGDRSAAENLDRPTELGMRAHQNWWASGYQRLFQYVIDASVLAPKGYLRGRRGKDEFGRDVVLLANGQPRTVRVKFPDLDDITPAALVDAIVKADQTGKIGPLAVVRKLADALQIDLEEALAEVTDDAGEWEAPANTRVALELDLMRANVAATRAGAASAAAGGGVASSRGTTQKNTPAENPSDPAPSAADPAESPTKARNRAQRAPNQSGGTADGGTQKPDAQA